MPADRTSFLQFIQTILPISAREAEEVARHFTGTILQKNDILLEEGTVCNDYYFLTSGFVRAYTYDKNGNDITTNFYSGNQVVCELSSFFKRQPTGETFQALTDCHAWCISYDQLQVAFHSLPEFREFNRLVLVGAYAELKQRMLNMLHLTAEERYNLLVASQPEIFRHAPLKHVATYLGITSTSLSRIRKEVSRR
ncbi:Crp/Fnr family transcriptional regulator [Paraflavisolibacter sp. H34]|uniref:Crp/Fnr family transcriptional regulator n=1 Tax=Huijunlia imazamoxiresistens TaxID=3127457 RepID=UPI003015E852